ncbi:MAG: hypothetical protein J6B10_08455 [Lachnospiraceae bacterium]|nr:hypothetical protein [Lachnospiraceae bacterium]
MYIRKVCYLDYLEHGVRLGNAGYARLCLNGNQFTLEMQVKGLGQGETLQAWIELEGMKGTLASISIEGGAGRFCGRFDADNIAGSGIGFHALTGLRIPLPNDRMIQTEFGFIQPQQKTEIIQAAEQIRLEVTSQSEAASQTEAASQSEAVSPSEVVIQPEAATQPGIPRSKSYTEAPEKPMQFRAADGLLSVDKWEQLCRMYQQLHPFGDKTYISLTPKDFIILRKEYQQLVNNSFLLHGYYNYRHLILGKEEGKEGDIYYLGVPGTYYDREKMVAVMFGFEGFEASGREEAAKESGFAMPPGTFGYYMKRVEI